MSSSFSTCDFCDAHRDDASGGFRVLPPVFREFGAVRSFHGRVATVRCHEDNSLIRAALEQPGAGRVLVVDGGASLRHALLGGNLGLAAQRNGWAGLVIDGCVRDLGEIGPLALGIRALAAMPMPPAKRGEGQTDVAVRIQGVWVRPSDWLYADEDGIVVSDKPLF